MATSASEEDSITVLHESSGSSENNTLTELVSRVRDKHTSRQWRRCKFRGIGSRSILLIIIWTLISTFSLFTTMIQYNPHSSTRNIESDYLLVFIIILLLLAVIIIISEVVISRYKLVRYSFRAMWFLSVMDTVFKILAYSMSITSSEVSLVEMALRRLAYALLLAASLASSIPLGIDQIITGSNESVSAFIHWMVWAYSSGLFLAKALAIAYECTSYGPREVSMVLSLVPVLLLSVGLTLDFFFSHKLVQEPVTVNPVTLIFKVLKYAAKHKHPVQRSAFTYCDDQQPSRLDYGKFKYGGPFTTEQVEDVKTFWRILLVLIVVCSLCLPLIPIIHVLSVYNGCIETLCYETTESLSLAMYAVPVYELLMYPCLRHRGPRILQSIGIGAAAIVFSLLYGLTADTTQYFTSNGTEQCLFTQRETCLTSYIPFKASLGLAILLVVKSTLEFICAQAPYNMRGLLIGVSITTSLFFCVIGILLRYYWKEKIARSDTSRYGIWYHLTAVVLGVVSSVLLVCVIRWYKARERDEIVNYQGMVEDIYYKYQQQEALQQQ